MEVPGRDVTADRLGPDDPPAPEVTRETTDPADRDRTADAGDRGEGGGIGDKVRDVVDKVKDAVTPDKDNPNVTGGPTDPPTETKDPLRDPRPDAPADRRP
jgi:hypothetical protein